MKEYAIKVENLFKIYHLYSQPIDRLKEVLNPFKSCYHKDFYALKDVSFCINKGETVGIIGKNGAGKSTLLKIVTGVLTQSSGSVKINGKIASLLELGAGFNPEMTGIENIYLNGTIMGFSKAAMDKKINSILEFADIGEFIHQPVKVYSSGMSARLAFSVAINVQPDILIVDEVLSVGDVRFQAKSIKKMEQIKDAGTTILFVSHSTEQIKRFCTNVIWLDNATVRLCGDTSLVANSYIDEMQLQNKTEIKSYKHYKSDDIAIISHYNVNKISFCVFDDVELKIKYEVFDDNLDDLLIGVAIYDNNRNYIFGPNTYLDKYSIVNTKGSHKIIYRIPKIPLLSGTYFFDIGLFLNKGIVNIDYHQNAISFLIENDYFTEGKVYLNHEWYQ